MGNLGEGVRAFDAIAGNAALAADVNGLQDQLKAMLGPRVIDITANGQGAGLSGTSWAFNHSGGYWDNAGNASEIIFFPFCLYAGQIITQIEVSVTGSAGATGGTADFAYGPKGAAMTTVNLIGATGNFWDTAGVGFGNELVLDYDIADAQLPKTVAADSIYYVYVVGPTGGTLPARIWNVQITTQFGT